MYLLGWLLAMILPIFIFVYLLKLDEKYYWIRRVYFTMGFLLPIGMVLFFDILNPTLYFTFYGSLCFCFAIYSSYRYGLIGYFQILLLGFWLYFPILEMYL
jgi:hypothetical protein